MCNLVKGVHMIIVSVVAQVQRTNLRVGKVLYAYISLVRSMNAFSIATVAVKGASKAFSHKKGVNPLCSLRPLI